MGLSRLIDALPGLVWTALPDGRAEFVNQRWRDYTGLNSEQASGHGWLAAIHPEDVDVVFKSWRGFLESDRAGEVEARLRRHDGQYRRFLFRAAPIVDAGRVLQWCGINIDIEERLQAAEHARAAGEAELQRAHRSLVDAQRLSKTGSYITNLVADEHVWSDEMYRIFEFAPGSRISINVVRDMVHREDLESFEGVLKRALTEGDPRDHYFRIVTSSGKTKHLHSVGYKTDDGKLVGSIQDVTDRLLAEGALKAREAELESMLRQLTGAYRSLADAQRLSLTGSFITDLATEERIWSDELYRIFEFEPGTRISTPALIDRVHPGDRESFEGVLKRVLTEGAAPDHCFRIITPSGKVKHLRALGYKTEGDKGQSLIVGAMQDVTEGKLAEEGLQAREAELRRAYYHLTEAQRLTNSGSFITDLARDEHLWSDELYRIFDFSPGSKVTTQRVQQIVHPEDLQNFQEMIGRALGGENVQFSFRIITRPGFVKHIHGKARLTEQATGPSVFVGALQDVTVATMAEKALSEARAELANMSRSMALGTLTASIAHEINQPLFGIITNADTCSRMLSANPPDVDGAFVQAQRILRDGNRASEVIQRLRAMFARKQPIMESVDLSDAAREVLSLTLSQLQRGSVVIRTDFADDLPSARGDRVQLQQVILNLILNAADAMTNVVDRPREMHLSTACDDPTEVRFAVRDCGAGIDPQQTQKLFEAFYTTKAHGMGVGLSISRSIIESHRGRLWAIPNDGPGATFSFSIPCDSVTIHSNGRPSAG